MDLATIMLCVATLMGVPAIEPPPVEVVSQERIDQLTVPGYVAGQTVNRFGQAPKWGVYVPLTRKIYVLDLERRKLAHEFAHALQHAHGLPLTEPAAIEVERVCG